MIYFNDLIPMAMKFDFMSVELALARAYVRNVYSQTSMKLY